MHYPRLCLVYHLVHLGDERSIPKPLDLTTQATVLRECLSNWRKTSPKSPFLILPFDHRYTARGLTSWKALKNMDQARAQLLLELTRMGVCCAGICLVESNDYCVALDENDDDVEVETSNQYIQEIMTLDGSTVTPCHVKLPAEEMVLSDEVPMLSRFSGGKSWNCFKCEMLDQQLLEDGSWDGENQTRRYQHYGLIFWPRNKDALVKIIVDYDNINLDKLRASVLSLSAEEIDSQGVAYQEALKWAEAFVSFWEGKREVSDWKERGGSDDDEEDEDFDDDDEDDEGWEEDSELLFWDRDLEKSEKKRLWERKRARTTCCLKDVLSFVQIVGTLKASHIILLLFIKDIRPLNSLGRHPEACDLVFLTLFQLGGFTSSMASISRFFQRSKDVRLEDKITTLTTFTKHAVEYFRGDLAGAEEKQEVEKAMRHCFAAVTEDVIRSKPKS